MARLAANLRQLSLQVSAAIAPGGGFPYLKRNETGRRWASWIIGGSFFMRYLLGLFVALSLSACGATRDLAGPVDPVGDFRLGFTVVVTSSEYTQGPASRAAEPDEWTEPLKTAFETRFKRFEGDRFYHLGVIVEGFVLAQPGIPVVLSPKSALIFRLTVIEDSTGTQLTVEPEQMTVLEEFSAASVFGSGLVYTKEKQLQLLSEAAARRAEKFLREKEDEWFAEKPPLIVDGEEVTAGPAKEEPAETTETAPEETQDAQPEPAEEETAPEGEEAASN